MPNYPKQTGSVGTVFHLDGFWSKENHPLRTGTDNLIEYKSNYEVTIVRNAVRDQWLEIDTDVIKEETNVPRRKQWTIFRAMAKRGEISFKRINTDTFIKLNSGELIDVPISRDTRIKGPVEEIDGVDHYLWCMTCKGVDNLTPSALTHNQMVDVRHYTCSDCQKTRKDRMTVPFRKYETERAQRRRYQRLYNELKAQK